jgi:hypothetical protein
MAVTESQVPVPEHQQEHGHAGAASATAKDSNNVGTEEGLVESSIQAWRNESNR